MWLYFYFYFIFIFIFSISVPCVRLYNNNNNSCYLSQCSTGGSKAAVGGPAGSAMAWPLFLPRSFFLLFFATRGEIFSLKFTKYRSADGLRPDTLGELKRSLDPLAAIRGPTSKGTERKGRGGEGGEERGEEGKPLLAGPLFKSPLRLWEENRNKIRKLKIHERKLKSLSVSVDGSAVKMLASKFPVVSPYVNNEDELQRHGTRS